MEEAPNDNQRNCFDKNQRNVVLEWKKEFDGKDCFLNFVLQFACKNISGSTQITVLKPACDLELQKKHLSPKLKLRHWPGD